MLDELKTILDFIKYKQTLAESKNTLLFAVDSGIIIALATLISTNTMPEIVITISYFLILTMTISIILVLFSMWSFNLDLSYKSGYKSPANSIMHYDFLINYTPNELLSALDPEKKQFNIIEMSLAQEIIINAMVTKRKYRIFSINVTITIISIIIVFLFFIYHIVLRFTLIRIPAIAP